MLIYDYNNCMNERKKTFILSAVFLAVLLISVFITHHVTHYILDEDTSGDLLLANCMYDEGTLIPDDWFFGNEFRIFSQLVWALFFAVFTDWGTVRFIGTLIIQCMLLCSFAFMLHTAGLKTNTILFGCILLLLPYCVAYGRIILYHAHYTLYMTFSFLILGLVFLLGKKIEQGTSAPKSLFLYFILALVCAYSSISGIREFYIFFVPLAGMIFWQLLIFRKKDHLFLMLFCVAAGFCGFLLNHFVISRLINVGVDNSMSIGFKGLSRLYMILFAILRQFGYRSGVVRGSFLGVMSIAGAAVAFYLIFSSGKVLFQRKDAGRQILSGFLAVQIIFNIGTLLFYDPPHMTRYDFSRYLVPSSIWCIPLLCCLYEERKTVFRKAVYAAALVIFIGNGLINWCFFQNTDHFTQDYDGLAYITTDLVEEYSEAMAFILENGYDLGYAVYDANVLIEKMNGLPVVWLEKTVDGGLIYKDLLTRRSYREIRGEKPFFIAFLNEAQTFRALPCSEGSELVFSDGDVFVFELKDQSALKNYLD